MSGNVAKTHETFGASVTLIGMQAGRTEYVRSTDSFHPRCVAARPTGVTILAWLVLAGAAFLLGSGALVAAGKVPLAWGAPLLNGLELMGPSIFLLAAVLIAAIGYGMLKLQRWSRLATIVLAAWVLAAAIPGLSSAVANIRPWAIARQGAVIIGSIMAIRYLIDAPVRSAFAATRSGSE